MSRLICLLSFSVLCGLSIFEKTTNMAGANIRLVLAIAFAAALVSVVKKEFSEILR